MTTYTTKGSVRRCCGHEHKSLETARKCMTKDQNLCHGLGGGSFSDRKIVAVEDGLSDWQVRLDYTRPLNDDEYETLAMLDEDAGY